MFTKFYFAFLKITFDFLDVCGGGRLVSLGCMMERKRQHKGVPKWMWGLEHEGQYGRTPGRLGCPSMRTHGLTLGFVLGFFYAFF